MGGTASRRHRPRWRTGSALPDFIVIGAKKCATTSLHRYLDAHPEIAMASPKELDFFTGSRWNFDRGLDWYRSRFDPSAPVRGETSPTYTMFPHAPGVPERIRSAVGDVKLIYIVRDPVKRMISQYGQLWGHGWEWRTISDLFADPGFEQSDYVSKSRYQMQIEQYLQHFDSSLLLVVTQEDLLSDRGATLGRIFRFLGVDEGFSSPEFARRHNAARDYRVATGVDRRVARALGARNPVSTVMRLWPVKRALSRRLEVPQLDPSVRETVTNYVRDDVEGLRRFTGQRFERWSI